MMFGPVSYVFDIATILYWIVDPLRNYSAKVRIGVETIILIVSLYDFAYVMSN